jgi:uncharacterized protein YhdP
VRWTDEQRDAAPIALEAVRLELRNRLGRHEIHLSATPPVEWGDRFSLTGHFTQPLFAHHGDWQRWSGNVFVDLPRADVAAFPQHLSLPVDLSEAVGRLRGSIEVKSGRFAAATFDVALRAVTLRLAPDLEPLALREIAGRLIARRSAKGLTLGAQHLTFRDQDGGVWPRGDIELSGWQRSTGGALSAQRLDLAQLAKVAARLPLTAALRAKLRDLDPQGSVSELAASWEGPLDAPRHYRARAAISGLSLAARASPGAVGRPGFRGVSVQLDACDVGGHAHVELHDGAIELPGVLDEPSLPLDQLSAQLVWSVDPAKVPGQLPKLTLRVDQARLSNADAQAELFARWNTGEGRGRYPGHLELNAGLSQGVARRMHRYLPLAIPNDTRQYIAYAVQSGTLKRASIHVAGDLAEFPFAARGGPKTGEFTIKAEIAAALIAFVPSTPTFTSPWPTLTNANVELLVDRGTLELRDGRAQLGELQWSKIHGVLDYLESDPVLRLDSEAHGPLAAMLRTVDETPVARWTGRALAHSTGTGRADLTLALELPLKHIDTASAKGSLRLGGNDLRMTPGSPLIADARGRLDYSNDGFSVASATAKLYGGDVTFDARSQPEGGVKITGRGTFTAEGLRRAGSPVALARVSPWLAGQAAYRATLTIVHGKPELHLESDLVGLAIRLPAPLDKPAEVPLALRYQTTLDRTSLAGGTPRDALRLDLGELIHAHYVRDLSGDQPRVLRGGVGVLAAAPQPAAGVAANLQLKSLATDDWEAVSDSLREAAAAGRAGTAAPSGETTERPGYVPDSIAFRVEELTTRQRRLTHLSGNLRQHSGVWRADVEADQVAGQIEYRPASPNGASAARVHARLSRFSLPKSKTFGRLEIEALDRAGTPDWQFTKFDITTPEAQFVATGRWSVGNSAPLHGVPVEHHTIMNFKLQVSDGGALLDRLGTKQAIRGGKGQLSGQIEWQGSPFVLDYASLSGRINVAIDSGQLLKVEPGAARLIGVISLQALPRRFLLDFRDLFARGFAFDDIRGHVAIARGVASSHDLKLRGVQALVLIAGSADLERETQDLSVVVVPELNAGTAALACAAISPAIGVGAFVAQALLKRPLSAAATREFHVTGPWSEPHVDPARSAAPAASASTD